MTDSEWMDLVNSTKERYLAEGCSDTKARKLTADFMRNLRLEMARKSLEAANGKR